MGIPGCRPLVRRAARGESLFNPEVKEKMSAGLAETAGEDPRFDALTAQERKVLHYIGEGLTNKEIGQTMFLAEKTVKNYVSSLLAKLGFQRRTQAAVFIATARGWPED